MARRCASVAALLLLTLLAGCGGGGSSLECAPYARSLSGIQLYGPAYAWWDEAAGHYARTQHPERGSVLVFRRSSRLPDGHVSVVRRVLSDRLILVDQANWVHHRVGKDDQVLDVSPENDWTAVRVWWPPSGALGVTTYATYGFIGPPAATARIAAN
jgi:surface antigen